MDYLLVSASSTSDTQALDELSVQRALRSSLSSACGQTASTYIDILAFLDDQGIPQSIGKTAQVVLRVNSACASSHSEFFPVDSRDKDDRQKDNLLAAIAYSQDQVRFSVKQESKFLVSLLPCLRPRPFWEAPVQWPSS